MNRKLLGTVYVTNTIYGTGKFYFDASKELEKKVGKLDIEGKTIVCTLSLFVGLLWPIILVKDSIILMNVLHKRYITKRI
jgi:hypothetical protein